MSEILDILAPADPIYTTDIVGFDGYINGDYYPYFNGTSAACPFAAGSVACLQSAVLSKTGGYLTPEAVRAILTGTGDPVTDTKVLITKPRINLGMAIPSLATVGPIYVEEDCILNGWDPNADANTVRQNRTHESFVRPPTNGCPDPGRKDRAPGDGVRPRF